MNKNTTQVAVIYEPDFRLDVFSVSLKADMKVAFEEFCAKARVLDDIELISARIAMGFFEVERITDGEDIDHLLMQELLDAYDYDEEELRSNLELFHNASDCPSICNATLEFEGDKTLVFFDSECWTDNVIAFPLRADFS